jgi:hypothetical protein
VTLTEVCALLIDLDGVLYVEDEPIAGAVGAVRRLRERGLLLRFVTNTTAHSRDRTRCVQRCDFLVTGSVGSAGSPNGRSPNVSWCAPRYSAARVRRPARSSIPVGARGRRGLGHV